MWLFGYGSLIWKADFPYKQKLPGYIKGYIRRFYQGSTDHRGIPNEPGRVVTLLNSNDPESIVWGMAYEIEKEEYDKVIGHLDTRERCGYDKIPVTFFPKNGTPFPVFVYIGSANNAWYLGEADTNTIAEQIVKSVGPSGTNVDYLFQLATAMRMLAPDYNDSHLFELEDAVHNILNRGR